MKQFYIDPLSPSYKTKKVWQKSIGNDHAFLLHRSDTLEYLKRIHDELGFEYIRFHGIFCDDMLTWQKLSDLIDLPGAKFVEEVNFRQAGHVYDNVLKAGMKPFVELSFMPTPLASQSIYSMGYHANITPPADYDLWYAYIQKFITYCIDRYGQDEVRQWYFEVWNEPDLDTFFTGTMEEYFHLYEVTVKAIKDIDPLIRVGGPSTSKNRWIKEFMEFCEKNHVPCDFISTHHYPGLPFGNRIDKTPQILSAVQKGAGKTISEVNRNMFYHPEILKDFEKGMLTRQDRQVLDLINGKYPLCYTEWNGTSVFGADVNDTKDSACFLIKTIMDLPPEIEMYSYWCACDLFEELYALSAPFHGSFGIMTIDGIPKPNYWAFSILSQLYDHRLDYPVYTNEEIEMAAFEQNGNLQVLLYKQNMEPNDDEEIVKINVNGTFSKVTEQRIDDTHCNPYKIWKEMGKPADLKPAQIESIKKATYLIEEERPVSNTIETTLKTNDIVLYTFYR